MPAKRCRSLYHYRRFAPILLPWHPKLGQNQRLFARHLLDGARQFQGGFGVLSDKNNLIANAITNYHELHFIIFATSKLYKYPDEITICNSGGFPYGVNLNNLLTINSSPRSRLLTEVVEKTGLIERSGQGVDIMFRNCLMEGKALPDYSASDDYQVQLSISATVVMPYLALLIRDFQNSRAIDKQLSVFDMLTLYSIACHNDTYFYPNSIKKLLEEELIMPDTYFQYILSDTYFKHFPPVANGLFKASDIRQVYYLLQHDGDISMSDFIQVFANEYSVKQIRTLVEKMFENQIIGREGKGKATRYKWIKSKNGEI